MKKIFKLLIEYGEKIGNGLMHVRFFVDGSGMVYAETDLELFTFNNIGELKKKLKKGIKEGVNIPENYFYK